MSYCFKRDVTKLQTIKIKIDRVRRKENPLGWALPQQSIKGYLWFELRFATDFPSQQEVSPPFCCCRSGHCILQLPWSPELTLRQLILYEDMLGESKAVKIFLVFSN
ncbi:hypothetical protein T09_13527 [Trichinella sp. T9]|nr:hypothetical protein T09_13527 [Trichinella sp. T9]